MMFDSDHRSAVILFRIFVETHFQGEIVAAWMPVNPNRSKKAEYIPDLSVPKASFIQLTRVSFTALSILQFVTPQIRLFLFPACGQEGNSHLEWSITGILIAGN